jgi:hypothetical protein
MRIFFLVMLLHIGSNLRAQTGNDHQVFNTGFKSPPLVKITGGNIYIYRENNNDTLYNYKIIPWPDSAHFNKEDLPLEIKPKTGVWYQPFCAYPMDEDAAVRGVLVPDFNSKGLGHPRQETITIKYNGSVKMYKLFTTPGWQSLPSGGCIFNCKKLPAILLFGDLADSKNQFVLTFK